jgi:hypothetical protein
MKIPRHLALVLLGLTIAAQIATPAWLVGRLEWLRRNGQEVLVPCQAFDPYDPLRGRYVTINPQLEAIPVREGGNIERGDEYFLRAAPDEEGVYRFVDASTSAPEGVPYLTLRSRGWRTSAGTVRPRLPFRRYYMNEAMAPEAERVYRNALRSMRGTDEKRVELRLRIHRGRGAVDGILIDGRPIEEFIKKVSE